MTLSEIFTQILNAIEKKNYLHVEGYCQLALDHIEAGKDIGEHNKEESVMHLTRIRDEARREIEREKKKKELIEQIVNQQNLPNIRK